MSDRKARQAAALAALAASKRGGVRLSSTVKEEHESLFVDAAADAQDDFVVDADGLGYSDSDDGNSQPGGDEYEDAMAADTRGPARSRNRTQPRGDAAAIRGPVESGIEAMRARSVHVDSAQARMLARAAETPSTVAHSRAPIRDDALEAMLEQLDAPEPQQRQAARGWNPFAASRGDLDTQIASHVSYDMDFDEPAGVVDAPVGADEPAQDEEGAPAGRAGGAEARGVPGKPRVRPTTAVSGKVLAPSQLRELAKARLGEASTSPAARPDAPVARNAWIADVGSQGSASDSGAPSAAVLSGPLPTVRVKVERRNGVWRLPGGETPPGAAAPEPGEVESSLFYWIDAQEDRAHGSVLLFGKLLLNPVEVMTAGADASRAAAARPQFASACVSVSGLERCLFFLPRVSHADTGEPVAFTDVYNEVAALLRRKLRSGTKFGCKRVTRNYAFEVAGVPREPTDYLKVVYDATQPALDAATLLQEGGRTFSHVFGTNTSPLEHLLLKRDLMGPCWLRLLEPVRRMEGSVSTSPFEICVSSPKHVLRYGVAAVAPTGDAADAATAAAPVEPPLPTPDLVVMVLSTKTIVHPKSHVHELVAVAAVVHRRVSADGPSDEGPSVLSSAILVRPVSQAQMLPADLRPAITKLPEAVRQSVSVDANERALLNHFIAHMAKVDPDVLVGHNILGFDLDVITRRCDVHKLPWSRLGRVRSVHGALRAGKAAFMATAGRLVCDTYLASRELLRETTYTLGSLASTQLNETRQEVDPLDVPTYLTGERATADSVLALLQHTENDARLALRLMFKLQVLPLTKQLTNLAGNLWSRSLRGARAERIEYLLLHEFHRLKYIVPDKTFPGAAAPQRSSAAVPDEDGEPEDLDVAAALEDVDAEGGDAKKGGAAPRLTGTIARNAKKRGKPAYTGGLVLEPKRGLYDKFVLLLDFNSLYPSIIQEYNLCFTTVERKRGGAADPDAAADGAVEVEVPALPDRTRFTEEGVLPRVIRVLVQRRRQVKSMMGSERDAAKKQALDIRQKALKILANSMYGCLGFTFSRFYARPIAALVTSQGREILQRTVDLAQDTLGCEVIYGDTDSIMIYTAKTDLKEVKAMGAAVKKEVNKLYRRLEIEIDGIFACMLLLKKKKYAALTVAEGAGGAVTLTREMKGLDMVRRDWSVLSREVGTRILDLILSGREREDIVDAIHAALKQIGSDVRAGMYSVDKFVITKGLNKNPHDYPDVKGQPHLQVALAMLKAGKPVNVGDHIPYVICTELATDSSAAASGGAPGASPGDAPAAKLASNAQGIAARAFHPDEVKKAGSRLHIDYEWYLSHDVLQPVARLCEPIEGTSQAVLAECLGLDGSKFANHHAATRREEEIFIPRTAATFEERFASVERVRGVCSVCREVSSFTGAYNAVPLPSSGKDASPAAELRSGLACPKLSCSGLLVPVQGAGPRTPAVMDFDALRVRLASATEALLREALLKMASSPWSCTDASCRYTSKAVTATGRCPASGCRGTLVQQAGSAREVHAQIDFMVSAFDTHRQRERYMKLHDADPLHMPVPPVLPPEHRDVCEAVRASAQRLLDRCAYHYVSTDIFRYVHAVNGRDARKAKPAVAEEALEPRKAARMVA